MAAKRTPLGHKRRGEAAAAFEPQRRTVRQRYALGMRQAYRQRIANARAGAAQPNPGVVPFGIRGRSEPRAYGARFFGSVETS